MTVMVEKYTLLNADGMDIIIALIIYSRRIEPFERDDKFDGEM